eukprot:4394365-Prymnesium_polylepis.1
MRGSIATGSIVQKVEEAPAAWCMLAWHARPLSWLSSIRCTPSADCAKKTLANAEPWTPTTTAARAISRRIARQPIDSASWLLHAPPPGSTTISRNGGASEALSAARKCASLSANRSIGRGRCR